MSVPLDFSKQAYRDLDERLEYHDSISPTIGSDYRRTLQRTLDYIQRFPMGSAIAYGTNRVVKIGKFKDLLYYRFANGEITVSMIVYGVRDRDVIRERLS